MVKAQATEQGAIISEFLCDATGGLSYFDKDSELPVYETEITKYGSERMVEWQSRPEQPLQFSTKPFHTTSQYSPLIILASGHGALASHMDLGPGGGIQPLMRSTVRSMIFKATDCNWDFPEALIDKELIGGVERVLHLWIEGLKKQSGRQFGERLAEETMGAMRGTHFRPLWGWKGVLCAAGFGILPPRGLLF